MASAGWLPTDARVGGFFLEHLRTAQVLLAGPPAVSVEPAGKGRFLPPARQRSAIMGLILLIVVILLLFGGGGGYYAYNNWGPQGGIGIVGIVVIIIVVLFLMRGRF
jgi:hypothetical protein